MSNVTPLRNNFKTRETLSNDPNRRSEKSVSIKNWYPFYPLDFDRDTMILTPEERGFYRDILDLYWIHEGNILEKNLINLAKKRGYSAQKSRKTWRIVATFFEVVEGKLVNKKMDFLMLEAARKRDIAVANGRAGGVATAQRALSGLPSSQQQSKSLEGSSAAPPRGDYATALVPERASDWAAFFVNLHGYDFAQAKTPKTMPKFREWCDAKISLDEMETVIECAKAQLGEMPNSPNYFDGFLKALRKSEQSQSSDLRKGESPAERGARLQRMIDEQDGSLG